jgi:hypothetical protein
MMSIQARETFTPQFGVAHPLRAYPVNSPRAKARLIVLALLADGQLEKAEFDSLEKRGVYASLGLSREDFVAVLLDFCSDVARLPSNRGSYMLAPAVLDDLLDEVDDPAARKALMWHIAATICSDGRLAEGEEQLFRQAIDAWQLRRPAASAARGPSAGDGRRPRKTWPPAGQRQQRCRRWRTRR